MTNPWMRVPRRDPARRGPLEKDFQRAVLELARVCKWRCLHIRPAMTQHGWRTPLSADGVGFPDILALRGDDIIVAELKAGTGRLSTEQREWLRAFQEAGIDAYVWRPDDWPEIATVLKGDKKR